MGSSEPVILFDQLFMELGQVVSLDPHGSTGTAVSVMFG